MISYLFFFEAQVRDDKMWGWRFKRFIIVCISHWGVCSCWVTGSTKKKKKPQEKATYCPGESILARNLYGISLLILKTNPSILWSKMQTCTWFFFFFQWKQGILKKLLSCRAVPGLDVLAFRCKANACSHFSAISDTLGETFGILANNLIWHPRKLKHKEKTSN